MFANYKLLHSSMSHASFNSVTIRGSFLKKKFIYNKSVHVFDFKDIKKVGWMDLIVTLRFGYDGPSNCASTIKINNAKNGLRVLFATLCPCSTRRSDKGSDWDAPVRP